MQIVRDGFINQNDTPNMLLNVDDAALEAYRKRRDFLKNSQDKFDEINNLPLRDCFNFIDVLIDGKFEEELKIDNGLRGSSNQNIIFFSDKLKEEELLFD